MKTIENSYCVPSTVEEWRELGADESWEFREDSVVYASKPFGKNVDIVKHFSNKVLAGPVIRNGSEVPVSRFPDLLHDRIAPWRLEELGFNMYELPYKLEVQGSVDKHIIQITETGRFIFLHGGHMEGITTFTDLLTLIRMLTPPTEQK